MGFHEDDRIRRKNSQYGWYQYDDEPDTSKESKDTEHHNLHIDKNLPLVDVISALKDAGFKVELGYGNTITVKKR